MFAGSASAAAAPTRAPALAGAWALSSPLVTRYGRYMEVSRAVMAKATALLDEGVPFALCTVAAVKGSVPGKLGAKMIVLEDGSAFGTVGGAGLEEKVKALGRQCLSERKSGYFTFDLACYKEGGLDSLCGGSVEIFVEPMAVRPHVLICGGGHVGLEVAKLCDQLEYRYSVLDDRDEYAAAERFPSARGRFVARPEGFFPSADLSPYSHIVLLGYSYHLDTDILFHCVRRYPGWIGVIASRTKRKQMFMRLEARGMAAEELSRIEAPVGLPIGSESPAECAVSILASIIRWHKLGSSPAQPAVAARLDRRAEIPKRVRVRR
jgi:xanthine dehydrogenase accessory factor